MRIHFSEHIVLYILLLDNIESPPSVGNLRLILNIITLLQYPFQTT